MAELQKLAFGGDEIQYNQLPGLGSRFALGSRDIQEVAPVAINVAALGTRHASPALEEVTAASVQNSGLYEPEVKAKAKPKHTEKEPALLDVTATPTSGTAEEQFISLAESPKISATAATPKGTEQGSQALAEQTTAVSPAGRELPWNQASAHIRSPLLRLHTEIVEFCRFLEPTPAEAAMREAATQRVRQAIIDVFPTASVQVFGSYVTGLYLPTSDIDLVVMDSRAADVKIALYAVSRKLHELGMARGTQVVAKAKVPIIKFIEHESNVNFDISFDVPNGPIAAGFVRDLMDTLPPMKPLVLVLKIFLQQRGFNEVYQGGIGSYALFVMVAAFLLVHPSRHPHRAGSQRAGVLEKSMGVLLVDFLRLFGRTLNSEDVGISCTSGGYFFNKLDMDKAQFARPYMLCVEDPADADNDLSKGSYNFPKVKQAWDFAYQQLTADSDASESLLERIIRVDTVLTDRPRPKDPPVPEQLEQHIRDVMHHRSKRSRHEGACNERKQRHRGKEKDRDGSRHKDKKQRRERSLEFADPDLDVPKDRARQRSHRSSSKEEERGPKREGSHRSSSKDDKRSRKRHKEKDRAKDRHHTLVKHHRSDHHRSSNDRSSSDRHQPKHIRFSEHE
ncbi:hypothetical protein ABBQ32_012323 [Trebouxia sp. C0010 RCD-2024]